MNRGPNALLVGEDGVAVDDLDDAGHSGAAGWNDTKTDDDENRNSLHSIVRVSEEPRRRRSPAGVGARKIARPLSSDNWHFVSPTNNSSPGKWAGIAACAAFTLGKIGREMHHRMSRRSKGMLPDL